MESRKTVGGCREVGGKRLDGNVATKLGVVRAVDLAHAAFSQQRSDRVRTDALAEESHAWSG
jgi:hypothetical protein